MRFPLVHWHSLSISHTPATRRLIHPSKEHFPQLRCILQWTSQLDRFLHYLMCLSMFALLHHLLPLSLQLLSSRSLSPAPHQSLFCRTISESAPVLSLSSFGLSSHFHHSSLVFPRGTHLKWCFITTSSRQTFPQLLFSEDICPFKGQCFVVIFYPLSDNSSSDIV